MIYKNKLKDIIRNIIEEESKNTMMPELKGFSQKALNMAINSNPKYEDEYGIDNPSGFKNETKVLLGFNQIESALYDYEHGAGVNNKLYVINTGTTKLIVIKTSVKGKFNLISESGELVVDAGTMDDVIQAYESVSNDDSDSLYRLSPDFHTISKTNQLRDDRQADKPKGLRDARTQSEWDNTIRGRAFDKLAKQKAEKVLDSWVDELVEHIKDNKSEIIETLSTMSSGKPSYSYSGTQLWSALGFPELVTGGKVKDELTHKFNQKGL